MFSSHILYLELGSVGEWSLPGCLIKNMNQYEPYIFDMVSYNIKSVSVEIKKF